jgi:hypothetical protein
LTSLGHAGPAAADAESSSGKAVDVAEEAVKRTMHRGRDTPADQVEAQTEMTSLAERMCYACLTAFSNGTSGLRKKGDDPDAERFEVELPYWVTRRMRGHASDGDGVDGEPGEVVATNEMGREEMKAVVGEFLIDEDEDA